MYPGTFFMPACLHSNVLFHPLQTTRASNSNSENGNILIEVQGNGPGIPDEIKDKILQPFFTTMKGTQGTDLGLSITHDIVKAHGGNLSITSKPGETKFTIILITDL